MQVDCGEMFGIVRSSTTRRSVHALPPASRRLAQQALEGRIRSQGEADPLGFFWWGKRVASHDIRGAATQPPLLIGAVCRVEKLSAHVPVHRLALLCRPRSGMGFNRRKMEAERKAKADAEVAARRAADSQVLVATRNA
jgi:hypothetical protein